MQNARAQPAEPPELSCCRALPPATAWADNAVAVKTGPEIDVAQHLKEQVMTETAINNTGAGALTPTAKPSLWKAAVMSGVVAAAATSTTAAIARAGDVTLAVKGEQIPISGFALITVVGAVLGLILAAVLSRRATRPRRTFLQTTAVLTVLSLVPDAFADTTTASKLVLALTHLIAAAIIVPSLAARLATT